jgi:hypothetical protein
MESVADPSAVELSKKVTVPVGVPLNGAATLAVKVTVWPNATGFEFDETTVIGVAWLIVSVTGTEVLVAKFASPLYLAVSEKDPIGKDETFSCARLLASGTEPKEVVPFKNVTVPVAVALLGACTVALRATVCPKDAGFAPTLKYVEVFGGFITCVRTADVPAR